MNEVSEKQLVTITDIWGSKHQVEKHYLDNPDIHNIPIEESDPKNQTDEQGIIQRPSIQIKAFIGFQIVKNTGHYYEHQSNQIIRNTSEALQLLAEAVLLHSDHFIDEPTWELRQIAQGQIENPEFI